MKKYTIEIIDEDGSLIMNRLNDGFNAHELLGLVTHVQQDLIKQIEGTIEPDVIKRSVIED